MNPFSQECITLDESDDEDDRKAAPTVNGSKEGETSKMDTDETSSDSVLSSTLAAQSGDSSERQKVRWAFFHRPEDLDQLLESLNPRGFREGPLKQALLAEKRNILRHCDKCPTTTLQGGGEDVRLAAAENTAPSTKSASSSKATASAAASNGPSSFTVTDQIELNYRDGILELEERLLQAQLGSIRVKDRAAWREAIVNRNYDRRGAKGLVWSGKEEMSEEEIAELGESVVGDMAKATLQLRQAVDDKYLIPPLGAPEEKETKKTEKEKKKKRKKAEEDDDEEEEDEEEEEEAPSKPVSESWEESLMRVKNFSQLYVHLSTLENSIAWQKSALNAMCKICRRKGDPEKVGCF